MGISVYRTGIELYIIGIEGYNRLSGLYRSGTAGAISGSLRPLSLRRKSLEHRRKSWEIIVPDLTGGPLELPVAGCAVPAGFPSPAEDFAEMSLDLNRELVRNPASTFFARVRGVSMTGEGIGDGDLLVVDRAAEVRDGALAVCCIDGEFTLKRIKTDKAAGCLWLMPAHPDYEPLRVTEEDDFRVWGVVRYVIKKF